MKLNPMPVGARVTIRKTSRFYGKHPNSNPAGEVGVVEECEEERRLPYRVRWLHSNTINGYRREDLKYWKGRAPKKKQPPLSMEELVAKAIAKCKEHREDVTARYAFITKKGTVKVSWNTACHHNVLSRDKSDKKTTASIVTCIDGHKGLKETFKEGELVAYYDWLLNRSPYANAFETKDADYAFNKSRYVVCNVGAPANVLQGGLVTSRQPWEHPDVVKVFNTMRKLGVDENTAFLIGCFFRLGGGSLLVVSFQGSGHFPLETSNMTTQDCLAFIQNKPHELTKPYNQGGESMAVHDMFCSPVWGDKSTLKAYLKKIVREAGKKVEVTTNPFAAAKKADDEGVSPAKLANYILTKGIFT